MPIIRNADDAVRKIPKGKRIAIGSNAAAPAELIAALARNADWFSDNEIVHLLLLGKADLATEDHLGHFRDNSFFMGANVRRAVREGLADYTPIFLSEIPRLLRSPSFPIAAALVSVSPPDRYGFCSLGVSVDIVKAAVESADIIIAEINKRMPRTFGQTFVRYDEFDYVVETDYPLPELPLIPPDDVTDAIGRHVASLVSDGSVLQLGIGAIPNAVLANLRDKHELGVHTEMLSDGIIDLLVNGNITNRTKQVVEGRILTSFCMGSRRLYEFVHENPLVEFYPSDFVNDPFVIAKNDNMISVNSALQVDLTGQVCADSIGHQPYSGIGGQVDFTRGAARSKGGKPIIALPSTAKNGTVSRIVPELLPGAGVVTSRGDVHYVVTEFGIAHLFGKTLRQRAMELIEIAHPDLRSELLDFVKRTKHVYFDQQLLDKSSRYPRELEERSRFGNEEYFVRPMKITDEERLQAFFYSHTEETLRHRYFFVPKTMPHQIAQKLVHLDYRTQMALVVLKPGEYDDRIVAVGRYIGKPGDDTVEIAVVVGEPYQGQGMGPYLCQKLCLFASQQGFRNVKAYVLMDNVHMRHTLEKLGEQFGNIQTRIDDGVVEYSIQLPPAGGE